MNRRVSELASLAGFLFTSGKFTEQEAIEIFAKLVAHEAIGIMAMEFLEHMDIAVAIDTTEKHFGIKE
jgi:hypothetical protein